MAFKDFCKKVKVKTIQIYESKLYDTKSDVLGERVELMHVVSKCQTEIDFAQAQESTQT